MPSPVEDIKIKSNGLRGHLADDLKDQLTASVPEDSQQLVKFHGMYMQDDRDVRERRERKKLERLYSFMIRLRIPGGKMTPKQWLGMQDLSNANATGTIKITTRQTIQFHGIVKSALKPTMQWFDRFGLDSIAACGDVNRNVTCASHPKESKVHEEVHAYADRISQYLKPKTNSFYDIWLDNERIAEKVAENPDETDPLYKDKYLPRKFKIGIAIPPNNDVDVFTNDIALVAVVENDELKGFNIAIGGGMGFTHGNEKTYPRLATDICYADKDDDVMQTIYEVVTIQRDYGNRDDRKLARLKYTLDNLGMDFYKEELAKRIGRPLKEVKPYRFETRKDHIGWHKGYDNKNYYTIFVEGGRVINHEGKASAKVKDALIEICKLNEEKNLGTSIIMTCNQNVIVGEVDDQDKKKIDEILKKHNIQNNDDNITALRENSIACVALNTCSLALAEGQRYLPDLITKIEKSLKKHKLDKKDITIRMTGCPNGCGRSRACEIGFVGTSMGKYNLYLGGDNEGYRLNKIYKESLGEEEIVNELDSLFGKYVLSDDFKNGKAFGDYCDGLLT